MAGQLLGTTSDVENKRVGGGDELGRGGKGNRAGKGPGDKTVIKKKRAASKQLP